MTLIARIAALSIAASAGAAVDLPLDDFSDGHDNRWERVDATEEYCDAGATYNAEHGFYRIESDCAIEPHSAAFAAATWLSDGKAATSGDDGYVSAVATHLSWSTNAWISLRSWGNEHIGLWGYRFEVAADGSRLAIVRVWEHDSTEILAEVYFARPLFSTGDPVRIEAGAIGRHLSLKVWSALDDEPGAPQITTCDRVLGAGDVSIGVSHHGGADGMIAALFDDIMYRPASADVNGDGDVDFRDVIALLDEWGASHFDSPADINGDGYVDQNDLDIVIRNLPSGRDC